jgi:hypothetical protein
MEPKEEPKKKPIDELLDMEEAHARVRESGRNRFSNTAARPVPRVDQWVNITEEVSNNNWIANSSWVADPLPTQTEIEEDF